MDRGDTERREMTRQRPISAAYNGRVNMANKPSKNPR